MSAHLALKVDEQHREAQNRSAHVDRYDAWQAGELCPQVHYVSAAHSYSSPPSCCDDFKRALFLWSVCLSAFTLLSPKKVRKNNFSVPTYVWSERFPEAAPALQVLQPGGGSLASMLMSSKYQAACYPPNHLGLSSRWLRSLRSSYRHTVQPFSPRHVVFTSASTFKLSPPPRTALPAPVWRTRLCCGWMKIMTLSHDSIQHHK